MCSTMSSGFVDANPHALHWWNFVSSFGTIFSLDGDVVADLHDLLQPVGDVDDGDALLQQLAHDLEQHLHLRRERLRALLEARTPRIAVERLARAVELPERLPARVGPEAPGALALRTIAVTAFGTGPADGHASILSGPVGSEVKRPEGPEVDFSCFFRAHRGNYTIFSPEASWKTRNAPDPRGPDALSWMVEIRGVEPLTFSMPLRRSTN